MRWLGAFAACFLVSCANEQPKTESPQTASSANQISSSKNEGASPKSSGSTSKTSGRSSLTPLLLGLEGTSTEEAIKQYIPLDTPRPLKWTNFHQAATRALKLRDYESADYLLDEAIKINPNNGELYYMRGRARSNSVRADYEKALDDLKKAKSMGALELGGYEYMAGIYDSRKQPEKAIEVLNEALSRYPDSKNLHHTRAVIFLSKGMKKEAKQDYDKILEINPKDGFTYLLRAQLLESMGGYEEALKDYELAAKWSTKRERVDKRTLAYKARALLLGRLGRHKEALDVLNKLGRLDTDDDEIKRMRGNEYLALKMYDKAIAELTQSIDMAPEYAAGAYESRARAYEAVGKLELANADKKEAEKLRDAPAERTMYKRK